MVVDPGAGEEELLATLAREPDLAAFSRPGAAALILSLDGERLLFSSAGARTLPELGISPDGAGVDGRARARLMGLAARVGSSPALRFERLRLGGGVLAAATTCACRRIGLVSGAQAILVLFLPASAPNSAWRRAGFAPDGFSPAQDGLGLERTWSPGAPDTPPPSEAGADAEAPGGDAAEAVSHLGARGNVRFLWQTDATARFSSVSPSLAAFVGEESGAIVGRRWREIAREIVEDDAGVADLLTQEATWSGRTVRWRIAGTPLGVAVDLSGTPIVDADRRFAGFRGFGLIRTDALSNWARTDEETAEPPPVSPSDAASGAAGASEAAATPSALAEHEETRSDGPEAVAGAGLPRPTEQGETGAEPVAPASPRPALSEREVASSQPRAATARPAPGAPRLSEAERSAFREIARALGARLTDADALAGDVASLRPSEPASALPTAFERARSAGRVRLPPADVPDARKVLSGLPVGVLVHRGDEPLFANRMLLDLLGYESAEAIRRDGGMPRLFVEAPSPVGHDGTTLSALTNRKGEAIAAELRLTAVEWGDAPASLILVRKAGEPEAVRRPQTGRGADDARARELAAILDTATDGVVVVDGSGRILSLNRSAEALFGYDEDEVAGDPLAVLLAPDSHGTANEYFAGVRAEGVASLMNDGREVVGRVRQGGSIPLFMTLGRIAEGPQPKYCAVLRDVTIFKTAEGELVAAKRAAEEAKARKADMLAKVSHEVRTPLGAIIGFAEVMLEERFGPVGNERYKDYLSDIRESGRRVVALVDDLLDLARIEAGRMELAFASVGLNELVAACVARLQPQAARERVVVRTSFTAKLPRILADERTLRQAFVNLVSNAIKFTEAGGQVIVSTAQTDRGEVAFRVRDTGAGMNADEIEAALEPFRQFATARRGGSAGLGLPLTKALVEANRAAFQITSARAEGTLAEVLFPRTRVLAD